MLTESNPKLFAKVVDLLSTGLLSSGFTSYCRWKRSSVRPERKVESLTITALSSLYTRIMLRKCSNNVPQRGAVWTLQTGPKTSAVVPGQAHYRNEWGKQEKTWIGRWSKGLHCIFTFCWGLWGISLRPQLFFFFLLFLLFFFSFSSSSSLSLLFLVTISSFPVAEGWMVSSHLNPIQ